MIVHPNGTGAGGGPPALAVIGWKSPLNGRARAVAVVRVAQLPAAAYRPGHYACQDSIIMLGAENTKLCRLFDPCHLKRPRRGDTRDDVNYGATTW